MTEVQNDVDSFQDVATMKEALVKLSLRVESLEKGALVDGGAVTNGDDGQNFRPVLVSALARMKEVHAALVTAMSAVSERLDKLTAAEETIQKQAYQIKHLKRSLEAEERYVKMSVLARQRFEASSCRVGC